MTKTGEAPPPPSRSTEVRLQSTVPHTHAHLCFSCCCVILHLHWLLLLNMQRQFSVTHSGGWGEKTPAKWPRLWGKRIVLPYRVQSSLPVQGGLGLKPLIPPALIHDSLLGFQMSSVGKCVLLLAPHVRPINTITAHQFRNWVAVHAFIYSSTGSCQGLVNRHKSQKKPKTARTDERVESMMKKKQKKSS